MSGESGFKSIAEALAAAAQAPKKTPSAMARRKPPAARPAAASAPAGDLRDDFDYAIEAVQTARVAMPRDPAAAAKMAANILAAKRKLRQPDAADLIQRAIRYLG